MTRERASIRQAKPRISTPEEGPASEPFKHNLASLIVTGLLFLLVILHVQGKPGRAWAALRQSQTTAVATGVHTTLYRLWAFALASFVTGVAGGLLAGAAGGVSIAQFPVQNNITLLAVVLMGGVYRVWGAVVGAFMFQVFPALLNDWGLGIEWLTILFGIGVIQVLLTAPGGLVEQVPKDLAKLRRKLTGGRGEARADVSEARL